MSRLDKKRLSGNACGFLQGLLTCRQTLSLVSMHIHTLFLLMVSLVRICIYFFMAIEKDVFLLPSKTKA